MKEREIIINIEKCVDNMNQEGECPDVGLGDLYTFKVCGIPMSVDVLGNGESLVKASSDAGGVSLSPDSGEKTNKGRRMSMSAKKPPRPPRGLSLDAADQKLIKEISELLMIKRARMKALKKAKAAKGMSASASTSSSGNLIAMFFTILFCIVIIFQGCHPWGIFPRNSSAVGIPVSPKSDGATEGNIVALENKRNLSSSTVYMVSKVRAFNLLVPGSNNKPAGREAIR